MVAGGPGARSGLGTGGWRSGLGTGADSGSGPVSVGEAVAAGVRALREAGVDTPRLDAEVLLAWVLGVDRARLVLDRDEALGEAPAKRYGSLVERRAAREPVAYLVGRREFRRLTLAVDPRVLIPRPETELLVEAALELAPGAAVVDVGTGSGAVALAVKDERPDLNVRGTDVSEDAVAVARANARALGLDVGFEVADLLDDGPVDAVLANLPYVPDGTVLQPEISLYEPAGALFGGGDGLDVVRRLVEMAARRRVGLVALEIGDGQGDAVAGLLTDAGWQGVEVRRDLAGLERVVVGMA